MTYLRIKDVAKLTGFNENTLYTWRQRQKAGQPVGPTFYDNIVPGMVLCNEDEVKEWAARNPREPEIVLPNNIQRKNGVKYVDAFTLGRMFSFSDGCILNWARTGRIPCIKMGGRYRFDPDAVLEALRRESEVGQTLAELDKEVENGN